MPYQVNIVNLRNSKVYDFRCDRQSPVGNPFIMRAEKERNDVCDRYEVYFNEEVDNEEYTLFRQYLDEMLTELKYKGSISLACWCAPKRCHCETIKKWLLANVGE